MNLSVAGVLNLRMRMYRSTSKKVEGRWESSNAHQNPSSSTRKASEKGASRAFIVT